MKKNIEKKLAKRKRKIDRRVKKRLVITDFGEPGRRWSVAIADGKGKSLTC